MDERASGIILRTRPLTETSLIIQWLTREHGRIATVAKGARRPKSPFLGKLDLFYEADFSFARSRRSELHTLREVSLKHTHAKLREDLPRLYAAAYGAILLEQGTERETPLPEHSALFSEVLAYLEGHVPSAAFLFALELKFLAISGLTPSTAALSPGARSVIEALTNTHLSAGSSLALPAAITSELSRVLRREIGTMLERIPPQRERLLQALAGTD